ncbi:MAG TPA: hypothetical protein VGG11_19180 [Xanthobacteraceae bacterium]|jgi:hypothetical protein
MFDRTAETVESICLKLHRLRIEIEGICFDVIPLKPNETMDGRVAALQQEESAEYVRLSATPSACLVDLSAKTDELHRVVSDSAADDAWLNSRLEALAKSVAEDTRRLAADEFNRPDKAAA